MAGFMMIAGLILMVLTIHKMKNQSYDEIEDATLVMKFKRQA